MSVSLDTKQIPAAPTPATGPLVLAAPREAFAVRLARVAPSESDSETNEEEVVLEGVSVMTEGHALGHVFDVDETTLKGLAALGNANPHGVLSRFGHDGRLGTNLGRVRGFTFLKASAGKPARVSANLHLADYAKRSPLGDLHTYVVDLSTKDPLAAGFSMSAYEAALVAKRKIGGKMLEVPVSNPYERDTGPDGKPETLYLRLGSLDHVDLVSEPATNPGGVFLGFGPGAAPTSLSERGSSVPPSTPRKETSSPMDGLPEVTAPPVPAAAPSPEVAALSARVVELERANASTLLELSIAKSGFTPDEVKALELSGTPAEQTIQLAAARKAFDLARATAPATTPAAHVGVGSTPAVATSAAPIQFSPADLARARGGK